MTLKRYCALRSGKYEGDEETRLRVLRQAAELGAPYIDVEFAAQAAFHADGEKLPCHTRLIMSHHNFERTLSKSELQGIERDMRAAGADIAKLAMTATNITDAWTMIELLKEQTGVHLRAHSTLFPDSSRGLGLRLKRASRHIPAVVTHAPRASGILCHSMYLTTA